MCLVELLGLRRTSKGKDTVEESPRRQLSWKRAWESQRLVGSALNTSTVWVDSVCNSWLTNSPCWLCKCDCLIDPALSDRKPINPGPSIELLNQGYSTRSRGYPQRRV